MSTTFKQQGLLLFLCFVTGSGGLNCLSCVDGVSPRLCHTTKKCSDMEECFTERHWNENGEVVFDTGCVTRKYCESQINGSDHQTIYHSVNPHYIHSTCLECCQGDLCNNKGCGRQGYPTSRGPVCFNCPQVQNPMLCDKIKVCEENQECFIQRMVEFGDVTYTTGCINKQSCHSSPTYTIFGKRNAVRCAMCCHTDLCNNNCSTSPETTASISITPPITTLPPTTQPTTKGMQRYEFLVLFMANHKTANGSEYANILTEGSSSLWITSSPNLSNVLMSKHNGVINFTSYVNTSFPNALTCQYLAKESKAILLTTSKPSTAIIFDSNTPGSNDGTIIIPTQKLSTRYLVSSVISSPQGHSQFAVGSLHSETDLNITLNYKNTGTITLLGQQLSSRDTFSTRLEKFETLQVKQDGDLTGTIITANKPIAVFSGNRCKVFPNTGSFCSHMVSQLPPTEEYDNEYIIPSFYQNKGTLVQVISPVKNSVHITLGYNITTRQFEANEYQNFNLISGQSSVIKSDYPVQVTGFAMGSKRNDPYMTVIPGIHHYLDYYKIIVPENYRDNFITVIIPEHSIGNLKINYLPIGNFHTAMPASNLTKVFQSHENTSGKAYIIRTLRIPHGVYILKTTDHIGFGLIVYGHKTVDGYGYAGNFVLP